LDWPGGFAAAGGFEVGAGWAGFAEAGFAGAAALGAADAEFGGIAPGDPAADGPAEGAA